MTAYTLDDVLRAAEIATVAHYGQRDKDGQAYIAHPFRVSASLPDSDRAGRIVGLLHDVVEDTDVTLDDLAMAGFSMEIITAVDAITRRDEPPDAYYERVKANPLALRVKRADIDDNLDHDRLDRLDLATRERLIRKYAHALAVLDC
jgi:(p)ppGpp synthase/HD superfamily hydrolase